MDHRSTLPRECWEGPDGAIRCKGGSVGLQNEQIMDPPFLESAGKDQKGNKGRRVVNIEERTHTKYIPTIL